QLLTVSPPKCHPLTALIRNLPRSRGRLSTRSSRRIERAHMDFHFSGLVRRVGHEAAVGRKARALHLSLAAEDFDRFAFSGRVERQSKQGVAAAKVCREIT